jgi:hypothetical protein
MHRSDAEAGYPFLKKGGHPCMRACAFVRSVRLLAVHEAGQAAAGLPTLEPRQRGARSSTRARRPPLPYEQDLGSSKKPSQFTPGPYSDAAGLRDVVSVVGQPLRDSYRRR